MVPILTTDTIVCLASGPSLTPADVAACRGVVPVIAINDTVDLAPWADVAYSSDTRWWPRRKYLPAFAGLRVRIDGTPWRPANRHAYPQWDQGVLVLRHMGDEGLELARDGLRSTKNSGGAAINLAMHLGARRIVLLGYDLSPDHGRQHFFDVGPSGHASPYPLFRRLIATMAAPLAAAGVAVINCSRRTTLTCFPQASLEETLPLRREAVA